MNKIELLAPAGDMERLQMAVAYGADAVYLAGNTFGMRSFAGNFSPEELKTAVELCRALGVRVHVTCNTMPRNDETARLPQWLEYLEELGVDAVILADVGVLALTKRHAPHVQCHISTQASIVNYQSARAWHDLGASRVILARELSLDEVAELERVCFPDPWSRNMLKEELENDLAAFLVALDGQGAVAGYAGLQVVLDEGYILNVAVRPDCRRQGVAGQLLQVFLDFAKGNQLAFLTLEVRASNYPAIALYGSRGFRGVGRRKNYYEHPKEDAVIMTLDLTGEEETDE